MSIYYLHDHQREEGKMESRKGREKTGIKEEKREREIGWKRFKEVRKEEKGRAKRDGEEGTERD